MLHGHGDDLYRYDRGIRANFSSNIWYGADLRGLMAHLADCTKAVTTYPEPDAAALGSRLADLHAIDPEQLIVTNGATEAFYLIARAWAGSRSLIIIPSFSEYNDSCTLHGHQIVFSNLDDMLHGQSSLEGIDLVWLCIPNNPDGRMVSMDLLKALFENHPETTFILDCSYADFTLEPVLKTEEIINFPNLIAVHSMTKQYGIAGLRLGYLAASAPFIRRIAAGRMPWSVNGLAIEAGHYLLDHAEAFRIPLLEYLTETARFRRAIGAIEGIETMPTACHFFTGVLQWGSAAEMKQYLVENHGLLIRDASNFRGYGAGFFRLATQRPEDNDRCVEAITQWMHFS